jgi:hypothetical protein
MMTLPLDQKSTQTQPPQMELVRVFFGERNVFEQRVVL